MSSVNDITCITTLGKKVACTDCKACAKRACVCVGRGKFIPKDAVAKRKSHHSGLQLVESRTKCIPPNLVELAQEIQRADVTVRATACGKLQVIVEQVRFLQEQARRVLQEAREANDLHHVACNFRKIPGHTYHLYQRESGQRYFSMLSPEEWGASCPHQFLGTHRLELDLSWTSEERMEERGSQYEMMNKILDTNQNLSISCAPTEQ